MSSATATAGPPIGEDSGDLEVLVGCPCGRVVHVAGSIGVLRARWPTWLVFFACVVNILLSVYTLYRLDVLVGAVALD